MEIGAMSRLTSYTRYRLSFVSTFRLKFVLIQALCGSSAKRCELPAIHTDLAKLLQFHCDFSSKSRYFEIVAPHLRLRRHGYDHAGVGGSHARPDH